MSETYHLVGIGGAGMSALARVLNSRGACVTGSDMYASPVLESLETEFGHRLSVGHDASAVGDADIVVASAAIKPDNPEIVEARRRGLPVVSRAELLGRVMDLYGVRVAVTGTHGKTTTSAMAAQMLEYAGVSPTALIGADVPAWRSNTRIGESDTIVAEACEAYGSFLSLHPTHAIVTNIEADHLDHYGTFDGVVRAFRMFAAQTASQMIVCAEGGADALLSGAAKAPTLTYGIDVGEVRGETLDSGRFAVRRAGKAIGEVRLAVPGRHNVLNALAAASLGICLGLPFDAVCEGLAAFRGTSRRFELLGGASNVTIVDDYAHHPTELRATLAAARAQFGGRRIVALFQPHLPSRTRDLMDDFAASFGDADAVVLTDIYLAREPEMPGISAEILATKIGRSHGGSVTFAGGLEGAEDVLRGMLRPGDVLLTLGAGNVRQVGEHLRDLPAPASERADGVLGKA